MKGILSHTEQAPFGEIPSEKTGSQGAGDWDRAGGLGSVVTGMSWIPEGGPPCKCSSSLPRSPSV